MDSSYSRARGPARLLLAAMAAAAGGDAVVSGLSAEELSRLAGVADRTYRRARAELLASGEELPGRTGGRGNTNCWQGVDPRAAGGSPRPAPPRDRRVPPSESARPLVATVPTAPVADANHPTMCILVAAQFEQRVAPRLAVAVVDVGGHLVAFERMEALDEPLTADRLELEARVATVARFALLPKGSVSR